MNPQLSNTSSLAPQELEAVYAISKVVAETIDIDDALDEIVRLARPVFIFDNAVLYLISESEEGFEPTYARAIGRGRSSEADIAWGEMAAKEVLSAGETYLHQPEKIDPDEDRINQAFFLGLPMAVAGSINGALIFIRFGGPSYSEDQINLAEFIASHVSQLFQHHRMVDRIAELEAQRRLARLQEDFIAAVSHELNTPLGFIKGYTTTLLRQDTTWDEDTRTNFLTIIDEETDRLSELIDDLIDSSRLQSGRMGMEFKTIDLHAILDEQLSRLKNHYADLEIHLEIPAGDLVIQADPTRLGQVIENLVSNAAKYAPGSVLTVSAEQNGEYARIEVTDTGPGIPTEHLEHVFKRFYRVPERSGGVRGSGLGLFICDQIITAHGGKISLDSQIGNGSRFIINLPMSGSIPPS